MNVYTEDNRVVNTCENDPVFDWLSQFTYGYSDDVYPLFENTQDEKMKEILQYADFVVVTQNTLYKRHILNEGGFMWPEREADDWFAASHTPKERWGYLKKVLQGIPRLKLPPYGAVRVRYKGEEPVLVYWLGGFYVAERGAEIVRYEEMKHEDFKQHIALLREKGQIF